MFTNYEPRNETNNNMDDRNVVSDFKIVNLT